MQSAPKFDVPKLDKAALGFGPMEDAYLTREQLGDWYGFPNTPQHEAIAKIFYQGGDLTEMGFTLKSGYDEKEVSAVLHALLRSWAPKHEIKFGTCAVALANWFDYKA